MAQTPTVGRIVLVVGILTRSGAEIQPAIITGINKNGSVNVQVFPDMGHITPYPDVVLFDTLEEAKTHIGTLDNPNAVAAYWPPIIRQPK